MATLTRSSSGGREYEISLLPESSLRSFLEKSTETYYRHNLPVSVAGQYLTTTRGLSPDSVKSFRLGYVDDPLPGHEDYQGRLAIPYLTRAGVVQIRFRALPGDPSPAKYLSMPGVDPTLYNVNDLSRPEPFVCVCEGEIDTITAHQAGLPAIGVPGVNGWRPWFRRCLQGFDAVYVLCDNDIPKARPGCTCNGDGTCRGHNPGAEFGHRLAAEVQNARVVLMPVGQDVNSFVVEHGPEALREKVLGK